MSSSDSIGWDLKMFQEYLFLLKWAFYCLREGIQSYIFWTDSVLVLKLCHVFLMVSTWNSNAKVTLLSTGNKEWCQELWAQYKHYLPVMISASVSLTQRTSVSSKIFGFRSDLAGAALVIVRTPCFLANSRTLEKTSNLCYTIDNILWAALVLIFFHRKVTKPNCN